LLNSFFKVARPEAPSVIVAVVCGGLIYWIIHKVLILRRIVSGSLHFTSLFTCIYPQCLYLEMYYGLLGTWFGGQFFLYPRKCRYQRYTSQTGIVHTRTVHNSTISEFGKEEANYKVQQNLDSDTVLHFDKVLILCPELLPPQTTDDDSDACLVAELLKKDRKYNRKNPTAAAFMAATLFSAAPVTLL
jgi:hypothetical protein